MKRPVLTLRPTQMSLGLIEVEDKVKRMRRMKPKALAKYISRQVPVVVGPGKELYMIDNHHFVRACWELGVKSVNIRIIHDWSRKSFNNFWEDMVNEELVYTNDQFGEAVSVDRWLPDNIKGLADDPYRSLAWMVREQGGFNKSAVPFSEFRWAELFRNCMVKHPKLNGYGPCIKEALKLCKTHGDGLPGNIL